MLFSLKDKAPTVTLLVTGVLILGDLSLALSTIGMDKVVS